MQREYVVVTEAISDEFTVSIFCMYNFTLYIKSHFYIMHAQYVKVVPSQSTNLHCIYVHYTHTHNIERDSHHNQQLRHCPCLPEAH